MQSILQCDYFYWSVATTKIPLLNGHPEKRLPNTLNISFIGYNGHEVLNNLYETAASTGSAYHSGLTTISPVLKKLEYRTKSGVVL
jgi:cysteine desulfurase